MNGSVPGFSAYWTPFPICTLDWVLCSILVLHAVYSINKWQFLLMSRGAITTHYQGEIKKEKHRKNMKKLWKTSLRCWMSCLMQVYYGLLWYFYFCWSDFNLSKPLSDSSGFGPLMAKRCLVTRGGETMNNLWRWIWDSTCLKKVLSGALPGDCFTGYSALPLKMS